MAAVALPSPSRSGPTGPSAGAAGAPRPSVWATGSPTGWVAAGFAGIGAGILAARAVGLHAPACVLRSTTGVPCPVCGITRLAVLLAHGHVPTALRQDAPGVALLVALAVTAVAQVLAGRGRPVRWLSARVLPVVLVGLLAAHWAVTALGGVA